MEDGTSIARAAETHSLDAISVGGPTPPRWRPAHPKSSSMLAKSNNQSILIGADDLSAGTC